MGRTFIINPKGHIQKAGSTVQSSTWSSLNAINELVDAMFPALEAGCRPDGGGLDPSGMTFLGGSGAAAAALAAVAGSEVSGGSSREGSLELRTYSSSSSIVTKALGSTATATVGGSGGSSIWGAPSRLGLGAVKDAKAGAEAEAAAVSAASSQTQLQQVSRQGSLASVSGAGGGGTLPRGTLLPPPTKVGPQREEFNDVQYWKPTLAFNIDEELQQLEAATRKNSSSGGGVDGVLRKPSSFY